MAERAVQFCEEDILIFNQCIKQDANKIFRINGNAPKVFWVDFAVYAEDFL